MTMVRSGRFSFLLPDPKDNEIKGEITQSGHHANVFCMVLMVASIIEIIERVNVFFSEEHIWSPYYFG